MKTTPKESPEVGKLSAWRSFDESNTYAHQIPTCVLSCKTSKRPTMTYETDGPRCILHLKSRTTDPCRMRMLEQKSWQLAVLRDMHTQTNAHSSSRLSGRRAWTSYRTLTGTSRSGWIISWIWKRASRCSLRFAISLHEDRYLGQMFLGFRRQ